MNTPHDQQSVSLKPFLVLPNGSLIRKDTVVSVKTLEAINLDTSLGGPHKPRVVIKYTVGDSDVDYVVIESNTNEERDRVAKFCHDQLMQEAQA